MHTSIYPRKPNEWINIFQLISISSQFPLFNTPISFTSLFIMLWVLYSHLLSISCSLSHSIWHAHSFFFSLFCLLKINFSLDVFILLLSIERYIYIFISIRQHQINKQCSCENAISNRRNWYGIFLNETNKEFTCVVAAPNGIYI